MEMQLYATGFNAWRQLEFDDPNNPPEDPVNPDDIVSFRPVLEDRYIGRPYASLSYTLGRFEVFQRRFRRAFTPLTRYLPMLVYSNAKLHCAGFDGEVPETRGIQDELLASSAAIAGNGKAAGKYMSQVLRSVCCI